MSQSYPQVVGKNLLMALALTSLISCGGGGWSEGDQQSFLSSCVGDDPDFRSACNCALERAEEKWDSYDQVDFGELAEFAFDCRMNEDR